MNANEARADLERRGIPFSEEQFLRQIRNGNRPVVESFLAAGVSPDAALDGESALARAAKSGHRDIVATLLKAGANPLTLAEHYPVPTKTRDTWEKLGTLSGVFTFLSSVLIAAVGWYFTNAYNQRQLELAQRQAERDQVSKEYQNRLSELQTVERMIPHLAKDESSKRAALVALSVLASPDLAARFAEVYGGQGSVDALKQIANANSQSPTAPAVSALTSLAARETTSSSTFAHDALASVLQGKERAIVHVGTGDFATCNGFVVDAERGWIATAAYCLTVAGRGDAKQPLRAWLWDGRRLDVREQKLDDRDLIGFARVDAQVLQGLRLSSASLHAGDTVTKLAFDLGIADQSPQFGVALGRIVKVGPIKFFSGGQREARGVGLTVRMPPSDEKTRGTAGAPLLDSEGNVACMTMQSGADRMEECVTAAEIRTALKAIGRS